MDQTNSEKSNGARAVEHYLEPIARTVGLVALLLPGIGYMVVLGGYLFSGLPSPSELAVSRSLMSLGAQGAGTMLGPIAAAAVVYLLVLWRPSTQEGRLTPAERKWGRAIQLTLVAFIVGSGLATSNFPGGTVSVAGAYWGGLILGKKTAKAIGQVSFPELLPSLSVLVLFSTLGSVLSPDYVPANYITFESLESRNGWYVELGRWEGGYYVHPCSAPSKEVVVAIPFGDVDHVTLDHSQSGRSAQSLLEIVFRDGSVDIGTHFDCPDSEYRPKFLLPTG